MSSSPLLTAVGICLAANSLVFTFGLYLLYALPSESKADSSWTTPEDLTKFKTAIATAILAHSRPNAPEKMSLHQQSQLEAQAQHLLQRAYNQAERRNFRNAIALLKQISPRTSIGARLHPKFVEYSYKQQIRANYLLQRAYDRAAVSDFTTALRYLKQIPTNTAAYERAVIKVTEYTHKQHFQLKAQQAPLPSRVSTSSQQRATSTAFHPDSRLQEVNITIAILSSVM